MKKEAEDYMKYLMEDIKGVKIAVPKEFFKDVQKPVERSVWKAICELEDLGATYCEISIKLLEYARLTSNAISPVEFLQNLSPYADRRLGYNVRQRIILGYSLISQKRRKYYEQATRIRTLNKRARKSFQELRCFGWAYHGYSAF